MSRRPELSLPRRVARFAQRAQLLPPGSTVAVAVSGGSDSVALFRVLLALERTLGIEVVGLAHVNHQLRGAASEADEQFCRELASASQRPVHVERVEIARGSGRPRRKSPEEAAREARYAALERAREVLGASLVALGHTRDDQAETILLRLLRGSGPDGLAGIPPRRGSYVRPLLASSRAELREWLLALGQRWVEDATNAETSVPRNAVRHRLLPELERYVPNASVILARHAAIARDESVWIAGFVNPAYERLVHPDGQGIRVTAALAAEPAALQRRVLLMALRSAGVRHAGFEEVEAVRTALAGGGRTVQQLPGGILANRIGGDVVLTSGTPGRGDTVAEFRYSLQVPGVVAVPEAGAVVEIVPRAPSPSPALAPGAVEAAVDGEALGSSVVVRNWRPGDAMRPLGLLGGRKKLQDIFMDAKVPRLERHRMPLLADEKDRVLWVPGLAIDKRLRVTGRTKAVVVLRLTKEQAQQVGGPE